MKKKKRLALVVGNSAYEHASRLKNPERDADAMASSFKKLGFDTMLFKNLALKEFKITVQGFGHAMKEYETIVFFFAGHGMQVSGINYLIPVDANPNGENQVEFECVDANWILSLMEDSEAVTNIIILDACRNNPFQRSWTRGPLREGLTSLHAPHGTLIAYSTAPNRTALDGEGDNSPYTLALTQEILNPSMNVNQLFQKVRAKVLKATENKQVPWESTSLLADFHFNQGEYVSIETFCYHLLYNNDKDRVLNHLKLTITDFKDIGDHGYMIDESDRKAGVMKHFVKEQVNMFEIFHAMEIKLYVSGERQYGFYANQCRDAAAVIAFSKTLFGKLGQGLYDDRKHKSFRNIDAIIRLAAGKAKESLDECFTMWSFGRVKFILYYTIQSRQLIFRVSFTPDRKVIKGVPGPLVKLEIQPMLATAQEIERKVDNEKIERIDYALHLSEPVLGIFTDAVIRVFGPNKVINPSTGINISFRVHKDKLKSDSLIQLIVMLISANGLDSNSNGYLEGDEIDALNKGEYWSGRTWHFNIQNQLHDMDSAVEMYSYGLYLTYDEETEEFDLTVIGFNAFVNASQHI